MFWFKLNYNIAALIFKFSKAHVSEISNYPKFWFLELLNFRYDSSMLHIYVVKLGLNLFTLNYIYWLK